jgi:DNA recombination protein RmuC
MLVVYLMISITTVLLLIAVFYLARNSNYKVFTDISYRLSNLQTEIERIEMTVNQIANRKEATSTSSERNELAIILASFKNDLAETIKEFNMQRDNFYALLSKQTEQNADAGLRFDSTQQTSEKNLNDIQTGNEQKDEN